MTTEEENLEVTDAEIFESATAETPKEVTPPKEEPTAETKPAEERPRDEKGRFAAKEQREETPAPEAVVELPGKEKEHHIPSWRLKEEADNRREAERRAAQLESMLAQYEARLAQLQPQPQEPEFPDFFQNPEALPQYFEYQLQKREQHWQQQFKAAVANMSLQRAHDKHGDLFTEAFENITSLPIQHPIRQQVINSPDPGELLVKLYRDQKNLSQIGDAGVDAFIQQKLEAALQDPEFLAKAVEKARGVASAQPTQKIHTPPSLNKIAGARMPSEEMTASDAELFKYATGR